MPGLLKTEHPFLTLPSIKQKILAGLNICDFLNSAGICVAARYNDLSGLKNLRGLVLPQLGKKPRRFKYLRFFEQCGNLCCSEVRRSVWFEKPARFGSPSIRQKTSQV